MADTLKLCLDVIRSNDIAIFEMTKIELHARLETPVKRHFINSNGPFTAVHGGGKMVRGV